MTASVPLREESLGAEGKELYILPELAHFTSPHILWAGDRNLAIDRRDEPGTLPHRQCFPRQPAGH